MLIVRHDLRQMSNEAINAHETSIKTAKLKIKNKLEEMPDIFDEETKKMQY